MWVARTSNIAIRWRSGDRRWDSRPHSNRLRRGWVDNQGAVGFTGLTLHVFTPNAPTASLTLPGYGTADLSSGRLSVGFGSEPDGTPFMHIIALG